MGNDNGFIFGAIGFCLMLCVVFFFGYSFGREYQCNEMGYEFSKGKCVIVTRIEIKK